MRKGPQLSSRKQQAALFITEKSCWCYHVLTDAIRCEIVTAAANEAGLVIQFDEVRPFGSPAFAAPVLLYGMTDEIVVAI